MDSTKAGSGEHSFSVIGHKYLRLQHPDVIHSIIRCIIRFIICSGIIRSSSTTNPPSTHPTTHDPSMIRLPFRFAPPGPGHLPVSPVKLAQPSATNNGNNRHIAASPPSPPGLKSHCFLVKPFATNANIEQLTTPSCSIDIIQALSSPSLSVFQLHL